MNKLADRKELLLWTVPHCLKKILDGTGAVEDDFLCAFIFDLTPQGHNYWWNQVERYKAGKPMLKTARKYIEALLKAKLRESK